MCQKIIVPLQRILRVHQVVDHHLVNSINLLDRDFIVETEQGLFLSDPVLGIWLHQRN